MSKQNIWSLQSAETGEEYPIDEPLWCSDDGGLLDVYYNGEFRAESVDKRYKGIWRYRKALPLDIKNFPVSFHEAASPVVEDSWNGIPVRFKLEYLFNTGSYKDRGAAVLVNKARELGVTRILEDSSGNAGCSIAAYACRAGIACDILVPASTSPAKIRQIEMYGATVHKINGTRQDVADEALRRAREGAYYASHAYNPFFFQGTKTFAYEVWEQCKIRFPRAILFPVGNGTLLLGAYIGFTELMRRNLIPDMPKLIAVQTTHVPSLSSDNTDHFLPTIAEGISAARPARKKQILEAIAATGGTVIQVNEEEIREAWKEMGQKGFYIEITSAVAWAGFKKCSEKENILLPLTGSGLKMS